MSKEEQSDINPELIQLVNICRSYGYGDTESFALKNFSLTVKRGEFIMLMGPSGCGKTTLLNILGLLDTPTSGAYYLNQKKINNLSSRNKARLRATSIGFVFQDFNLIQNLPVIENVALPLLYSGATKTHRLIQASDILSRFRLQEREYFYPSQLSGGQKQRVAIARSLVAKPEIILADEPTGNLDSRSSHIVMEELRRIHSEGNTIIMVTHNPNLTTYATRVIHMLDGGIDEDIKTVADENLPTRVDIKFAPLKKVEKSKKDTLKSKTEQKIEKTQKTAHKTLGKTKPKVNVPEKSTSKNSPNLSSKTTKSQQTSSKTKHFTYNSDPSVRIVPKPSIEDLVKKEKRS